MTVNRQRAITIGVLLAACLIGVIALDLITNELNRTYYKWDFIQYFDMAENGILHNDHLIAPFAYRFVTPLLAGGLADLFRTSTETGFRIVAYIGGVGQLALVYLLAQTLGLDAKRAVVTVLVVAFSLYNLKFLVFDVSRPDHLAYPLMVIAVWALFERRIVICLIASCIGLLVREFLIIPPLILLVMLGRDALAQRSRSILVWMGVIVVAVSVFVIVPRVAISVEQSGQYIDPIHKSDWLDKLIEAPLSERRDINLLFNLVSYTVPVWLLLTVGRARRAWQGLAGCRLFLALYTIGVLILSMYGGTDLWRFMTYLFIPQVIILAVLLRDPALDPAEVVYMLAAVAVYNKIFSDIPNYLDPYLDFYGGYDNRINVTTLNRLFEMAVFGGGMLLLRGLLVLNNRRRAV